MTLTSTPTHPAIAATPSNRPDRVIVVADHTPGHHRTDSHEIAWWLPVIGPTPAALAVTLAHHARHRNTTWDATELARRVGLAGNRHTLWHSLDRLALFGCATFVAVDVITIRLALPTLTARQMERLPDDMAAAYRLHHRR